MVRLRLGHALDTDWLDAVEGPDGSAGDAPDWLDAVEGPDGSAGASSAGAFSASGGGAPARRPNAHGGVLSRALTTPAALQPCHPEAGLAHSCCRLGGLELQLNSEFVVLYL